MATLDKTKQYGLADRTQTLMDASRNRLGGPTPHQVGCYKPDCSVLGVSCNVSLLCLGFAATCACMLTSMCALPQRMHGSPQTVECASCCSPCTP